MRGFTLVEILLVIAIISVFAAALVFIPGASRQSARDTRRISDLHGVEQALRLFFLKCGFYPGSYQAASKQCLGGLLNGNEATENPDDWVDLEYILVGAEIGVKKIPYNPLSGDYEYRVQLGDPVLGTPRAQCYWLYANLENPNHQALKDPKEFDGIINMTTVPGLYPQTPLDCGGSAYCLTNIEC